MTPERRLAHAIFTHAAGDVLTPLPPLKLQPDPRLAGEARKRRLTLVRQKIASGAFLIERTDPIIRFWQQVAEFGPRRRHSAQVVTALQLLRAEEQRLIQKRAH